MDLTERIWKFVLVTNYFLFVHHFTNQLRIVSGSFKKEFTNLQNIEISPLDVDIR